MKFLNYVFASMVLVSFLCAGTALAHKVNVFAYAEDGKIYVESYFPDGRPAAGSELKVYDSRGNLLAEGKTDGEGKFSFEIPRADDLKIVVNAGMGHKTDFKLKKSEVEAGK
ncbi:MAG: carboxypeptidase regulatory-like domain-containing protein [Desulfobacteraceae bacterium]|nr:carboxypeptidase regulatory-like domain-containing protein [Desulfobacteraceae bacterium]